MKDSFSFKNKIFREIKRLTFQLLNLPAYIFQYFFNNLYYTIFLENKKIITKGKIPFKEKIAIFLIYPNLGVDKSHLRTLEHLIERGYSPLVVSNLKLNEIDKDLISSKTIYLIERSNFGYDFGGYRDGVLFLANKISSLKKLILINDSCFLISASGSNDWVDFVDKSEKDLIGASSHFGYRKPSFNQALKNLSNLDFNFTYKSKNFHYASFALGISNSILKNPKFLKYWSSLKLSGKKNIVVRRGEIGFTKWVLKNKTYTHESLLDSSKIPDLLRGFDDEKLKEIIKNLIVENNKLLRLKTFYVSKIDELSKKELINLIMFNISRYNLAYSMANFIIEDLNFPFFKKIIFRLNKQSAEQGLLIASKKGFSEEIYRDKNLNIFLTQSKQI